MSCKKCVFQPTDISEKNGVTTITLEDGVLGDLCANEIFAISLTQSIPATNRCNRIVVTDGTVKKNIAKNNQYWRPSILPCGKDMLLQNKLDPETVAVFCRFTGGC